ncbi:hypothetical protein CHS0354_026628 [Potamilus streckersoni]|uniref:WAP domain-containing protein n=1 Tax=Potamilus streckersoni TaxID=2493646 RepID=A0AAE0SYA0_9BIVA|nr:hypothetical protein CHS0354_026628 [Potamilus streckersoni]
MLSAEKLLLLLAVSRLLECIAGQSFSRCPGGTIAGSLCNLQGTGSECNDYQICVSDPFSRGGGVCCEIPSTCPKQGPKCNLDGSGTRCKPGYTCNIIPNPKETFGKGVCCGNICPEGSNQGPACNVDRSGIPCKTGYRCIPIHGNHKQGVCCSSPISSHQNKTGTCPPPSGLAGICVFRPGINCLGDEECPLSYKCCPEGCGSVCKQVIYGSDDN